jgi:hypothetical protein
MPPGSLDDAVDGRESQSCALAAGLGCEERLECLRRDIVVHAGPRVFDFEADVAAGRNADPSFIGLLYRNVRRPDGDRATVDHCVAGIHGEVGEHLLELAAIHFHFPEIGRQSGVEGDVLADRAAEKLLHIGDD